MLVSLHCHSSPHTHTFGTHTPLQHTPTSPLSFKNTAPSLTPFLLELKYEPRLTQLAGCQCSAVFWRRSFLARRLDFDTCQRFSLVDQRGGKLQMLPRLNLGQGSGKVTRHNAHTPCTLPSLPPPPPRFSFSEKGLRIQVTALAVF